MWRLKNGLSDSRCPSCNLKPAKSKLHRRQERANLANGPFVICSLVSRCSLHPLCLVHFLSSFFFVVPVVKKTTRTTWTSHLPHPPNQLLNNSSTKDNSLVSTHKSSCCWWSIHTVTYIHTHRKQHTCTL